MFRNFAYRSLSRAVGEQVQDAQCCGYRFHVVLQILQ